MVSMRMEEKPAFKIIGRKTWINGTDSSQFGRFWQQCGEDGLLQTLSSIGRQPGSVTSGMFLGVSCVEKDPSVRDFYFYVAAESASGPDNDDLEEYTVPASRWAVFQNSGVLPDALIEAEMTAFMKWLPASSLRHAAAPEMEVYPPCDTMGETLVEFWLPVE